MEGQYHATYFRRTNNIRLYIHLIYMISNYLHGKWHRILTSVKNNRLTLCIHTFTYVMKLMQLTACVCQCNHLQSQS